MRMMLVEHISDNSPCSHLPSLIGIIFYPFHKRGNRGTKSLNNFSEVK